MPSAQATEKRYGRYYTDGSPCFEHPSAKGKGVNPNYLSINLDNDMILRFTTKDVCLIINSSGRVAVTRPGECVRTAPGCGEEGGDSGGNTGIESGANTGSNSGGGSGGGSAGSADSKPATATTTPMIDPYTTPSPIKMTCDNADLPVRSFKLDRWILNLRNPC